MRMAAFAAISGEKLTQGTYFTTDPVCRQSRQPGHSFDPFVWHRFSYCALGCLALLKQLDQINVASAANFVVRCRTFDGGFGITPGLSAKSFRTHSDIRSDICVCCSCPMCAQNERTAEACLASKLLKTRYCVWKCICKVLCTPLAVADDSLGQSALLSHCHALHTC